MLFGKTKRIKQLEMENEALRRTIDYVKRFPPVRVKKETFMARKILSSDMSRDFRESVIRDYLLAELTEKCPYITVSSEYDRFTGNFVMTASIDILVKER